MRRRDFIARLGSAGLGSGAGWPIMSHAQQSTPQAVPAFKLVRSKTQEIAYEDSGPEAGTPVILAHGFPYDPRAFDEVVPRLVAAGCRTIGPYLRCFGPTRFLSADTPRSGQQAAMGRDLIDLMDALKLPSATLAGFDWGGRGVCVVGALWPERGRGVVLAN